MQTDSQRQSDRDGQRKGKVRQHTSCCFGTVRPKLHGYTGCKRTCSVEQAVSCI